jgi:hypothetical protein
MLTGAFWFLADSRVWVDIHGARADVDVLTPQQVEALFPFDTPN